MRTRNFYKVSLCSFLLCHSVLANNITTGTVTLGNQNISAPNDAANYTEIQFDISWENAWRLSTGPANWDAAWIFAKYRIGTGDYHHAWLSPNAAHHSYDAGSSSHAITIEPALDSMGVFIHLANPGTAGLLDIKDLALRWYYRSNPLDPVDDNDQVTVQVFAIEMVYVPQGSFYLGDGNQTIATSAFSTNAFRKSNNSGTYSDANDAILISSEGAINFVNSTGYGAFDPAVSLDANTSYQAYTLPATFPKGFNAFYCMKYEGSVRQYVDFFNTLPNSGNARTNRNAQGGTANFRHGFQWGGTPAVDAVVRSTVSGHRAMGFLSIEDVLTYLDWAALRPMTELEYEKACRGHDTPHGPIYPIPREFAWGDATINTSTLAANGNSVTGGWSTHITNDGTTSEGVNAAIHNTFYANFGYSTLTIANRGPLRCGIFAAKTPFPSNNPRRVAGATYYGIMEMTGNLHEMCISPAVASTATTSTFRRVKASNYQGVHGDGEVDLTTGRFNQANWAYPQLGYTNNTPESGGMNPVLRGGYWRTQNAVTPRQHLAVSYRPPVQYSTTIASSTNQITANLAGMTTMGTATLTFASRPAVSSTGNYPNWPGIRGVRTAP